MFGTKRGAAEKKNEIEMAERTKNLNCDRFRPPPLPIFNNVVESRGVRGSEIEKSLSDIFVAKPDREGSEGCNNPAVTKRDTKPPASDTDSAIRRFIVVIKTTVAIPAMLAGWGSRYYSGCGTKEAWINR